MRLVKTIGDAAMLVGPTRTRCSTLALDLVDAADAEGEDFPQLRVGMAAGPRSAARATGTGARSTSPAASRPSRGPGSVLATREVRDAVAEAYRWSPAGARSLKGVEGPVRLYRARRLTRDDEDAEAA